jgi:hypothetical protein
MFGKGAPVLNLTIYPSVIFTVGPTIAAGAIYEQIQIVSITSGYMMHHPSLIRAALITAMPGGVVGLSLVGVFLGVLWYLDIYERWAHKHLPPEYHDYVRHVKEQQQN